MMDNTEKTAHAERRRVVSDLFAPRPLLYWTDFLLSAALGWTAFVLCVISAGWIPYLAAVIVAVLALYRAALFTHEVAHLYRGSLRYFGTIWNLLCGIPLLVPSFLYQGVHQQHHYRSNYGTGNDGEYLPFGTGPRYRIVLCLLSSLLFIPFLTLRFGILAPVSWVGKHPRFFVWHRMSSLSLDPAYRREVPRSIPPGWIVQETLCTLYIWSMILMMWLKVLPVEFVVQFYVVGTLITLVNLVRTLAAHRYLSTGTVLSLEGQFADSVNITGGLLTPVLAPLGLRYHALHHLYPTMPYHNLARAHRRLMARLPDDPGYARTLSPSTAQALLRLWQSAGANRHGTVTFNQIGN